MLPIISNIGSTFNKVGFWTRQHAPEIMIVGGVIGGITSTVLACVATTKMPDIINEAQEKINDVDRKLNDPDVGPDEYTPEEAKKDKMKIYLHTAGKTAKLYLPTLLVGGASVASVLGGSGILNKRNASLAAGLAASTASAKELRDRIIERYGEDVYNELRHGVKSVEVKEKVTDEDGKTKTVKKNIAVVDNDQTFEGYQRSFDSRNPYWDKDQAYNWMFLRFKQNFFNDKLRADGYVFLNDVLTELGFPKTRAGQEVGWVYDPKNPNIDNYVDFGAFEVVLHERNNERAILLAFNVDGSVINKAKWNDNK